MSGSASPNCPYCGGPMVNTGSPIWEDYCLNESCHGHRDAFFAELQRQREVEAKANKVRDAAPDMLSVLKFLLCVDFENFTEHDEALLESVLADAQAAVQKAEGVAA